jgi:hypothetical protein
MSGAGSRLHMEAAGIEAAKGGAALPRDQRPTPRFPYENGAPICPGESMRVRSIWSFFGPLDPLAGRELAPSTSPSLSSRTDILVYYYPSLGTPLLAVPEFRLSAPTGARRRGRDWLRRLHPQAQTEAMS